MPPVFLVDVDLRLDVIAGGSLVAEAAHTVSLRNSHSVNKQDSNSNITYDD